MKLAIVAAVVLSTSVARAENKRIRVPVSSLPRQDDAVTIDPSMAMLPEGVREGSAVPKSWTLPEVTPWGDESGRCADDRRGSVGISGGESTSTEKIWETNGTVFFDRAQLKNEAGKIHVVSAERRRVVYLSESVWAYRRADAVYLVTARDFASFSRSIIWGCFFVEQAASFPSGAVTIESSPAQVDEVLSELFNVVAQPKRTKPAPWRGVAFRLHASVSKASVDTEPMLNVVISKP